MNRGICETRDGVTYVADYVANLERRETIRIRCSRDLRNFETAWEFAPGAVRHIHALIPDPHRERLWVLTGDTDAESCIYYTDDAFASLELFLNHGQQTRATDLVFRDGRLLWGMDSPDETVHILTASADDPHDLRSVRELPGPVYYTGRNAAGA